MTSTSFWHTLPRPFSVLAPMENVTDTVFRQMILRCGRPDVFFTEFINVDWLQTKRWKGLVHRLDFLSEERPIVAQIWGTDPDKYARGTALIREMGFDGIDINMGCPAPKIRRKMTCSGLIRHPAHAARLIEAVKSEAGEMAVSVKTRLGFDRVETEAWCGFLLEQGLDALSVHGRIATEMSHYPADWDEIGKVVRLRDARNCDTVIIGNGDVSSLEEIEQKHRETRVDGVMVGRGIFRDPFIFDPTRRLADLDAAGRIALLLEHTRLFVEVWGESKDFDIMKKFFKIYIADFEGALPLREALMQQRSLEGVLEVLARHAPF